MANNTGNKPIQVNLDAFELEVFTSVLKRMKDALRLYNEYVEHANELGIEPADIEEGYRFMDEVNRTRSDEESAKETAASD